MHPISGAAGCPRRIHEHQFGVPSTLGMEAQSCIVIAAGGDQRLHDLGVNGRLAVRRNSSLNRHSRYLMAESKIISILDQQNVADQLIHDERIIDQGHQQLRPHRGPIRAATSSASRAGPLNAVVRARTASRTDAGRASLPACSTSVTKNGLPAVRRC